MTRTLTPILSGNVRPTRFGSERLADLLDQTLRRMAHRTAVRASGGQAPTYAHLGASARGIMQQLSAAGVVAGDVVAIKAPRSVDYIAAVLATQLMGATFAPLDAADPEQRIRLICERIRAQAIVTVAGGIKTEPMSLADRHADGGQPDIAYIMHTSGSTGAPKGVPISRAALLNLVDWYIDMLAFSEKSSMSHLSRPSFDFSIPELFVPFLTGGRIDLPDTRLEAQIVETVTFLARSRTRVIQLVPTLLRRVLQAIALMPAAGASLNGLRYMVCNGEVLPAPLARRFQAVLPEATLINSYGPTECCVAVTYHRCRRDPAPGPIFIGRPAPNTDAFVLDDDHKAVGFDVEGELWLGGVQTAPGYVDNPAETERRFRHFDTHRGRQRLYRTGDRVLCARDGGLQFLGRRDEQVKYRGVRLELGEIVHALERTDLCTGAAALVVGDDETGEQDLIGFVTPADADVGELSRQLAGSLPPAIRPRRIVALDALPATPNGKLDREGLARLAKELARGDAPTPAMPADEEGASRLRCLLAAVGRHVRSPVNSATPARQCAIDSLMFLEIQLDLAADGLLFAEDVYRDEEATLGSWAARLKPIEDRADVQDRANGARARRRDEGTLRRQLSRLLDAIGERAPGTVTVHSSLSAFRNFDSVRLSSMLIDMVRQLSRTSTVLLPTFTPSFCATGSYDWKASRSESGILGDLVLRDLPARRTRHPVYSMAVIGEGAAAFCDRDWWRHSPFGDDSIFGEISRRGGLILNIGTPVASHVHRCEFLAKVPYLKAVACEGVANFAEGALAVRSAVYVRDVAGRPEFTDLARDVARDCRELEAVTRRVTLAGTYASLVDVAAMESKLVGAMQAEPYGFLFADRQERARAAYPATTGSGSR